MSRNVFPKLKLKRKRSSVEPELCTRKQRSVNARAPAAESEAPAAESEAPAADTGHALPSAPASAPTSPPAATCTGADKLWVLTLSWVLQELQDPSGRVSKLPSPSTDGVQSCPAAAHWGLTHEDEVALLPELSSFVQSYPESEPTTDIALTPCSSQTPRTPYSSDLAPQHLGTESWASKDELTQSQRDRETSEGTERTKAAEDLLETCPMCLLRFPPGFSQLEQDSHLAQCLSNVNIDVSWVLTALLHPLFEGYCLYYYYCCFCCGSAAVLSTLTVDYVKQGWTMKVKMMNSPYVKQKQPS